jgi:hypothetical protein
LTTLPAVTLARETRPAIGARTCAYSMLRRAMRSAASAPWMSACEVRWPELRWSTSCFEIACWSSSFWARARSVCARSRRARIETSCDCGARHLGLERARVDREQQVALADEGAVDEVDLLDRAGDARPQLHVLRRLEPAAEFLVVGDRSLHRRATLTGGACCAPPCASAASPQATSVVALRSAKREGAAAPQIVEPMMASTRLPLGAVAPVRAGPCWPPLLFERSRLAGRGCGSARRREILVSERM